MSSAAPTRFLNRLAGVLLLLVLGFAVVFGWQAWLSEKQDQIGQLRTVLELTERSVDNHLQQMEASLKGLAADLLAPDGRTVDPTQAQGLINRVKALHPDVAAITFVALDGQVLASSNADPNAAPPNLAAEPAFVESVAELTPKSTMLLTRPLLGPVSRRWVMPLRYVMRDAQARPVAFVVASLPVELLQTFWQDAPVMTRALVGLLRDDGYLLSRYPAPEGATPEVSFGQPRDGALRQHLVQQGFPQEGYAEGFNQLSGKGYGNVFRRLGHYPVTLFVGMPMQAFRAAWWQRVKVPFALLGFLSLFGIAMYRYTLGRQLLWAAERERAQEVLEASEREQRFLVDHLLAGVIVHDTQGAVRTCNVQACRLLGLTHEQMTRQAPVDPGWHVLREDGSRMPQAEYPVARVLAAREPAPNLVLGVVAGRAAKPVWLIGNAYPEFDAAGLLRQVVVTFVDITPRKRVEQALAQSESHYRMLFENSMDAVLQTLPDGSVLAANGAACAMFGLSESGLKQRGSVGLADPTDPRMPRLLEERARTGRASGEMTMLRGDGQRFEAEISSAVYTDTAGQTVSSLVIRDVTEQRRAQAGLRAKELAERANRAKSEFVARMSHELRTPLNAILGFSEVLRLDAQHPLTPDQHEQLGHVQRAGNHLLLLINDLLDLSRIEAGALRVRLEDVNVLDVVHEAMQEVAAQADARQVRVLIDAPTGGPLIARGDRTRLRQVILNLLSNAIKYNRPGGRVNVQLAATTKRLRLSVRDSGLGMSQHQLDTLFEPFNRLGREASTIEGTGIGLVIARNLVELMGGTLKVRSQAGVGSEFSVELPLARAAAAAPGAPTAPSPADTLPFMLAGRVLYIDDDEVNRLLMQAYLGERAGIEFHAVSDGRAGIAHARDALPDLLLIDLMMPGMSGLDVLQALRADAMLRHIPCVAVSANAMPEEIGEALAAGFDGYLTKPLSLQALLTEMERLL